MELYNVNNVTNTPIELCAYCGEPKNKDQVLLGSKFVTKDISPCDDCKSKMEQGFTFVKLNPDNTIRGFIVLTLDEGYKFVNNLHIDDNIKKKLKELKYMFYRTDDTLAENDPNPVDFNIKINLEEQ